MKRTPIVAVSVALAGLLAAGCGGGSASPTSTTASAATKATPLEWLTSNARQWNGRLNGDQSRVDSAASSTSGATASTFFAHLTAACTALRDDAQHAMDAPQAPTEKLQNAWNAMLSATETYASKCLELAHSDSTADVTAWQNSLKSMNDASGNFNKVANAAAKVTGASTTTTTTHPAG